MNDILLAVTEKAFLQQHAMVESVRQVNGSPLIFWKDVHSVYFGCNDSFAKLAGFQKSADIIGLTDQDLIWDEYACAIYQAEDAQVCKDRTPLKEKKVPYLRADKGYCGQLIGTKVQLLDEQNVLVGIAGFYELLAPQKTIYEQINPVDMPDLLGDNSQFYIDKQSQIIFVTRREAEVLLYLILGYTCSQIANYMGISTRTIDSYFIVQLKRKLDCCSISQLIQTALRGQFLENFQ